MFSLSATTCSAGLPVPAEQGEGLPVPSGPCSARKKAVDAFISGLEGRPGEGHTQWELTESGIEEVIGGFLSIH